MFRLKLLGSPVLEGADGPLTGPVAHRQRLALMALLSVHRSGSVSRDKLQAYLWPESDIDRARRGLSNSLYVIKKELGPDAVLTVGDGLRLNPERVEVDVSAFEQAVEARNLETAVPLYPGPFLSGFFLRGAPEFDAWVETERDRLARSFSVVLGQLAQEAGNQGEGRRAVEWWRRLAAHEPYDARVALQLMEALDATGNRAGAVRHADLFAAKLREDLELDPEPDVMAFAERLRKQPILAPERAAPSATRGGASDELPVTEPATAAATVSLESKGRYAILAVALAAVLVTAAVVFRASDATLGGPADPPRIVVLPLANLSGADEEYFAEGMTEEIRSKLAGISGLRVIARQSAIRYAGSTKSASEIGDELDVDYVLEGAVRTERTSSGGGQVRITPQLIRTADESPVWTEAFTAPLVPGAIFDAQARIAARIAEGMGVALLGSERDAFGAQPNVDAEAYGYYLRAMSYATSGELLRRVEDLQLSVDLFERAVEADPDFAAPYAEMSRVYTRMAGRGGHALEELAPRAKETAERALQLAPNSFESHRAMGMYQRWIGRDWDLSQQHYRAALELRPYDSGILSEAGGGTDPESRVAYLRQALQLDPFNQFALSGLGQTYWRLGQLEEADRYFNLLIRRFPESPWGYFRKSMLYLTMGDIPTARAVVLLAPKHLDLLPLLLTTWDFDDRMVLRLFAEEFAGALERRSLHESDDSVAYYFAKADRASSDELPNLAESYYDSARVVLEGRKRGSSDARTVLNLASAYAALGRRDLAILTAEETSARSDAAYLSRAETYIWLGEYDRAMEQIARALESPSMDFSAALLRADPLWAPLRDHPRYQELVGEGDVGR